MESSADWADFFPEAGDDQDQWRDPTRSIDSHSCLRQLSLSASAAEPPADAPDANKANSTLQRPPVSAGAVRERGGFTNSVALATKCYRKACFPALLPRIIVQGYQLIRLGMRPDVIGIGAQKCASSWLHSVAGSHPEIGTSDPKEIDFFSYYFDRGYRWYESHFLASGAAKAYFESSPSYFHDPRAATRSRNYRPDLKVVVLLRDPIKRAFSNHLHEIVKGNIPPCPFEAGIENNPAYIEQGLFAKHLTHWFDAFPKAQIRVLFAEDVAADPTAAARALFVFLGVDPAFASPILHERRNESDRARLPSLRTGLRAGGDWMRRRGLEPTLARLKATAPVAAILKANRVDLRDEIPPMLPETEARLREIFAPECARLRQMLGRDSLPWETVTPVAAQ